MRKASVSYHIFHSSMILNRLLSLSTGVTNFVVIATFMFVSLSVVKLLTVVFSKCLLEEPTACNQSSLIYSTCEELCHKNPCRKCPINIYDELSCRCGQTVIQPPIECGTKPPTCNYKCNRTHACDHPVYHSCHNEEECPPCTHLVTKMCVGEHTLRNNVSL